MDAFYAESSKPAVRYRRLCYFRALSMWGESPRPNSADKVLHLAAYLRAGGYRSSSSILSQYKVDTERQGDMVDSTVLRALRDGTWACRRGQGPPIKAMALPFERLGNYPEDETHGYQTGPLARGML